MERKIEAHLMSINESLRRLGLLVDSVSMNGSQSRESGFVILDLPRHDLLVFRTKHLRALLSSLELKGRSIELFGNLGDSSLSICLSGSERRPMLFLGDEKLRLSFGSNLLKDGDVFVSTLGQSSLKSFRFGGLLLSQSSEGSGVV